jgi:hypothetical protein
MTSKLITFLIIAVFATGFAIGSLVGLYLPAEAASWDTFTTSHRGVQIDALQLPELDTQESTLSAVTNFIERSSGPTDKASPSDYFTNGDVEFLGNQVIIHVSDPQWAVVAPTKSMDPVFDYGTDLIEIFVKNPEQEVHAGDIVSYEIPEMGITIVHRVIEVGYDSEGWYAIFKGDNNESPDPWKVRDSEIRRKVIGMLY